MLIKLQPKIEYNDAMHSYMVDGAPALSVTQILEAAGIIDKRYYKPEHAERGIAVHDYAIRALRQEPGIADTYLDHLGYTYAMDKFVADIASQYDPSTVVAEALVASTTAADGGTVYAGRLDAALVINSEPTVVEIKTGYAQGWAKQQVAAYAKAAGIAHAIILELRDDGTYRVTPVNVAEAFAAFRATAEAAVWGWSADVREEIDTRAVSAKSTVSALYDVLLANRREMDAATCALEEQVAHLTAELAAAKEALDSARKPFQHKDKSIRDKLLDTIKGNPDARTRSVYVQTRYQPRVTDASLLPRDLLAPDMAAIRKAIGSRKTLADIPGVAVEPVASLVVRASGTDADA